MDVVNLKPVVESEATKHSNRSSGVVKTKTIYISTKAGQAKELQQRLASGKRIGIIRKPPNQSSCVKDEGGSMKPMNVSHVTVIQQTIPSRTGIPEREILWQTRGTGDGVQSPKMKSTEKVEIIYPKATTPKVAEGNSSTLTSGTKIRNVFPNYSVQKQQQQHQRIHQNRPPHQLQRQPQALLTPTGLRLIPVSAGIKPMDKTCSSPKLKIKPASTSKPTKDVELPRGTDSHPKTTQEQNKLNSSRTPQKSLLLSSSNLDPSRSPVFNQGQKSTKYTFPMSSLFSLDLKNSGPIAMRLPKTPKVTPSPTKTEPRDQGVRNKISAFLNKKTASPTPKIDRKELWETWPEEDAPLTAVSLQNGLQKALSLTPFSALLDEDEDVPEIKEEKSNKICSDAVTIESSQWTNIQRSQQIIDEQLTKIAAKAKKTETITKMNQTINSAAEISPENSIRVDEVTSSIKIEPKVVKSFKESEQRDIIDTKYCDQGVVMDNKDAKTPDLDHQTDDEKHKNSQHKEGEDDGLLKEVLKHILPKDAISPNSERIQVTVSNKTKSRRQQRGTTTAANKYSTENFHMSKYFSKKMKDCYKDMLNKWEKYLSWSPKTMRQFETSNALLHHYTPDAYEMVSNPDISVWSEIEDSKYIRNVRSPDLHPDDFLRDI